MGPPHSARWLLVMQTARGVPEGWYSSCSWLPPRVFVHEARWGVTVQAPLGAAAVSEMHKLFEWAKNTPRGLLLFIDEAEAFLGTRDREGGVSENLRNVLSALLYQTGTQSDHYMLVLATNRPEDLDRAITDRIDEALHFDLPRTEVCGVGCGASCFWRASPPPFPRAPPPTRHVLPYPPGARADAAPVFSAAHR